MANRWISASILAVLFAARARAGVVYLGDPNATIEASGQTVIGSAATFEAVFLLKAPGSGMIFEEIEPFGEDKFFQVGTGGVSGFLYPVNNPTVFTATATVAVDAWHHAAYVYDGAEERIYLDGTLLTSRAATGAAANSDGLAYIGASLVHDYTTFIGLLDSVRLSDVARYTGSSYTPPTGDMASDAHTLLLYDFDDPPGSTTVVDSGPLGRTGTPKSLHGGPTVSFCGTNATDLDGDLIPDTCDPDPPATTTTLTIATTTTTRPAFEICGNCIDDDGNGRIDFEDEACCGQGVATLTLKSGLVKPAAGGHAKLVLSGTLSQSGLTSGATPDQDVVVQLSKEGSAILCARIPVDSLKRKKTSVVFKDPSHAVAAALGIDRLTITQKKNGSGRLKASGKQAVLDAPTAGRLDVVLGLHGRFADGQSDRCARGGGTFRAKGKGVLKFP